MFKFCKINGGWWLACTTEEQLIEFHDRTDSRFGKAIINSAVNHEVSDFDKAITTVSELKAERNNESILISLSGIMRDIFINQLTEIYNGKTVYINSHGGWNTFFKNDQIEAVINRENLIFPSYTKEDIRITKFNSNEYGKHYYAHVGEIEISEGEGNNKRIKWNTYEEAYAAAEKYCNEE